MTWSPCCRIVQPVNGPALRLRGLAGLVSPSWPASNIGAGADYSVDFSPLLCGGEYVTQCSFGTTGNATQAWTSTFGNVVTAWLTWTTSGLITVPVAVETSLGNVFQVDVTICLSAEAALIAPTPPVAPGQSSLAQFKALYEQYRDSLPTTDPGDGVSDWNNSGIVTKSIASNGS